jgi:lipoyl(octanoyl) transferase
MMPATADLLIRRLGRQDYLPVFEAMRTFSLERHPRQIDEIWILEHNPVYTQGLNGNAQHLLAPGEIPVIQTDRGGQVTYHGPGQLVVYLLLDVKRRQLGVRRLVSTLEQSVVELVRAWGVTAASRADAPGVYVGQRKLASLGLRIRRGHSYHGLSLNVAMDLSPFRGIEPCGLVGMQMTQLSELCPGISLRATADALLPILTTKLGYTEVAERAGLPALVQTTACAAATMPSDSGSS